MKTFYRVIRNRYIQNDQIFVTIWLPTYEAANQIFEWEFETIGPVDTMRIEIAVFAENADHSRFPYNIGWRKTAKAFL